MTEGQGTGDYLTVIVHRSPEALDYVQDHRKAIVASTSTMQEHDTIKQTYQRTELDGFDERSRWKRAESQKSEKAKLVAF